MNHDSRFRPSSIALVVAIIALAIAGSLVLKTNRLESELRRRSSERPRSEPNATASVQMPEVDKTDPPVVMRSLSAERQDSPPFAREPLGDRETGEPKTDDQMRQEATDRYNRLFQAFLAQPTSTFDEKRANSMRTAFNTQFESKSFSADAHVGSLDCRGSMCTAEVKYVRLEDAQAMATAARSAAAEMRTETGQRPLVYFMALPRDDRGGETARIYFEWLPAR